MKMCQITEKYLAKLLNCGKYCLFFVAKIPSFLLILTAVGAFAYRREGGVYVVPIGCLKD